MKALDALRDAFLAVQATRPELTDDLVELTLQQIVATHGGERLLIPRRIGRYSIDPETREKAYAERYSGTREEVASRHGISRRTLYRLMQNGPRGRGKP